MAAGVTQAAAIIWLTLTAATHNMSLGMTIDTKLHRNINIQTYKVCVYHYYYSFHVMNITENNVDMGRSKIYGYEVTLVRH